MSDPPSLRVKPGRRGGGGPNLDDGVDGRHDAADEHHQARQQEHDPQRDEGGEDGVMVF